MFPRSTSRLTLWVCLSALLTAAIWADSFGRPLAMVRSSSLRAHAMTLGSHVGRRSRRNELIGSELKRFSAASYEIAQASSARAHSPYGQDFGSVLRSGASLSVAGFDNLPPGRAPPAA